MVEPGRAMVEQGRVEYTCNRHLGGVQDQIWDQVR